MGCTTDKMMQLLFIICRFCRAVGFVIVLKPIIFCRRKVSNMLLSSLVTLHMKDGGGNIATDERLGGVERSVDTCLQNQ